MLNFSYKRTNGEIRRIAGQRKEDNAVFYSNNLKDLVSEQAISEEIIDGSSFESDDGLFKFTRNEYRFTKFNDLIAGIDGAADENGLMQVAGVCFYYCDFSMCGFSNIRFADCAFVGCNFEECYTLGFAVIFDGCSFISKTPGKKSIDDAPCMFSKCELSAKIINCDISLAVFDNSHFYFSYFQDTNLWDVIFIDCSFDTSRINACDMRNTRILNPKFIEFYIEDSDKKTQVNKNTYLGIINYNRKEKREVKYALEVYSRFSELFESSKLMDLSGEYFYLYKKTEFYYLEWYSRIKSFFGLITCGYGERPSYSLLTSLVLILTCGTLYMLFGVSINNETLYFRPSLANPLPPPDDLVQWYHFSLVTFSTVGYGNVVPVGKSLLVSAVEMVLGVIMVGIWVSTLVRKMVR